MLALLNVVYLAWQWFGVSPDTGQPDTAETQLLLFSEYLQQNSKQANNAVAANKRPGPEAPLQAASRIGQASNAKACFTLGPFALINDVSDASHMFDKVSISNQQRAGSERKQAGLWVYIPPLESMQAARAVLRDLQNKGVRDALIISEGKNANAISAGVYYVEMHAERRRDVIRKYGYYAKIEELTRTQPQYWLDVELKNSTQIPQNLWWRVSKKYSNISQTKRACE